MILRDVPVRIVNTDPDWVVLAQPEPARVDIRFSGPVRELLRLTSGRTSVDIRINEVEDSLARFALRPADVQGLEGAQSTRVEAILADSVHVVFDQVVERVAPVATRYTGSPSSGLQLAGSLQPIPPSVRVRGAASRVVAFDSVVLDPIALGGLNGTDTIRVTIDTAELGLISVLPPAVDVVIPLRVPRPDTARTRDIAMTRARGRR